MEVAPAGLCRVVASILLGPRQWLPVTCGGCPRRPLSRRRLHSSRPGSGHRPSDDIDSSTWAYDVRGSLRESIFGLGLILQARMSTMQLDMAFTGVFSSGFDFNSFDEIFLFLYYYKNLTSLF